MIQIMAPNVVPGGKFENCSQFAGGDERKEGFKVKINILGAEMRRTEDGYVGAVRFEVEGHRHPYEAALHSKDGKDWAYGLFFMSDSGSERDIDRVEAYLEENDEAFDMLVDSAWRTLKV